MRLLCLFSTLVALGIAGRGTPPIAVATRKAFIDTFKENTNDAEKIEKLTKQLDALPGTVSRKDLAVLVSLSHLYYNDTTESDILLRTFDSFIDNAIEQKCGADVAKLQQHDWSNVVGDALYNQLRAEFHRIRAEEFPVIYNEQFGQCPKYKLVYDYIEDIFKYQEPYNGRKQINRIVSHITYSSESHCLKRNSIVNLLGDCPEAHECADQILEDNNTDISCAFGALVSCALQNNTEPLTELTPFSRGIFILKTQLDQLFLEEPSKFVQMAYSNFIQFFFEEFAEQLLEHATFVDPWPLIKKYVNIECEIQFNGQGEFEYCTQVRRAHATLVRIYRIVTTYWTEYVKVYQQLKDGDIDAVATNPTIVRYHSDLFHSPKTVYNAELFIDILDTLRELHSTYNGTSTGTCYIRAYSRAAILTIHSILPNTTYAQLTRDLQACPDPITVKDKSVFFPTTPSPVDSTTLGHVDSPTTEAPSKTAWCKYVAAKLVDIAAVINNKEMKTCDKLVKAVELGLEPGSVAYEAFKYLVHLRELYQEGVFHPSSYSAISIYNKIIFDKLQQGFLHNTTCSVEDCLSVKNPGQFVLSAEDKEAVIPIETQVKSGIDIGTAEIPKQIFTIAANTTTSAQERVTEIVGRLDINGTQANIRALITTYVEALEHEQVLIREFGHKQTSALIKHIQLVIVGSIREGVLLPLNMKQFGAILEFLKNVYTHEALFEATKLVIEWRLAEAGLLPEIVTLIIQQFSQLTLVQLESVYATIQKFDICPVATQPTTRYIPETTTTVAATTTPAAPASCNNTCPIHPPCPIPVPPFGYRMAIVEGFGYQPFGGPLPFAGPYPQQPYGAPFPYLNQPSDVKTRRSVHGNNNEAVKNIIKRSKRQTVEAYYADINKAAQFEQH